MEPRQVLDFLHRIEPLKTNTRHCYTAGGTHETVAAHTWRLATMAMLLRETFPDLDMNRVIDMCLAHDFGEAITGDIPTFVKTAANQTTEATAVNSLLAGLPAPTHARVLSLFDEMEEQATPEARLWRALDKLEAVIQHNESDIETWIPLEYELNQTYAAEEAACHPFLQALREQMRLDTLEKIRQAQSDKEATHEQLS